MIYIRSQAEIEKMWESNQIVYQTLCLLGKEIRPGVTTKFLDQLAEEFIRSQGARPAFKGFNGYPASICTSIDEQVVHGIPSSRVLKEGEIVGVDVGAEKDGYFGDAALTFAVGKVSEEKQRLMQVTEESLYRAIAVAQIGKRLSDIGHAVQSHVEANGFSVVRTLVGHGIGTHLHEAPEVPNYGEPGRGPELKPGMCLAIEPMVNTGTFDVYLLEDGWTVVTADQSPSAHFEHTIVIMENDPLILSTNKAG
jgi:methionyl aminopeptidase